LFYKGSNIDNTKAKVRIKVQHFLTHAFKKFYIGIWSCMLIEDVMEDFNLLLPQDFIDQFVFIWGPEQCSMTSSQFTVGNYYCFKDLSCVYFACQGLPYGKEDQTLFINHELSKAFRNLKSNVFF
jgi:hypothetical protein